MTDTRPEGRSRERVLLVAVRLGRQPSEEVEEHLAELSLLVGTAGGRTVGRIVQERARLDPAFLIGKGKARELAVIVRRDGVQTVIFDDELSPAQIRNLEETIEAKVIDRSALILDIFARRARSREARTQVELAQLQYLLPRLTRRWSHLSRQAGGTIGLRGVGETQLEIDRRLIRRRISRLKRDLRKVERGRRERRRSRDEVFKVALVGYTNAGKSTLFNALSGGDAAAVENRLFATLDPLVRRCRCAEGEFVAIDTVGFIRKLPHHLVASFRSTLEETVAADLLVHVVDLAHSRYEEQMETTRTVLDGMAAEGREVVLALNKSDLAAPAVRQRAREVFPAAIQISALSGLGIPALMEAIAEAMRRRAAGLAGEARPAAVSREATA